MLKHSITFIVVFTLSASAQAGIGDPLPGLTSEELALFNAGKAQFERDFTPTEGLGPLYNRTSCAACHGLPVTGGSDPEGTDNNVTHFGIRSSTRFYEAHELGGPVKQGISIAGQPGAETCGLAPEIPEFLQPFVPGMITSRRHTPPVFGFGLIDGISDKRLTDFAGKKPWKRSDVIGGANFGVEMEGLGRFRGFTLDQVPRTQVTGAPRVGRFGWKSQTGTLVQFSAEPFNIELGITSPFFKRENQPSLNPLPPECLVANSPVNDADGSMSRDLYYFQAFIAPPERGSTGFKEFLGEVAFHAIGCADCHRKTQKTTNDYYAPWPDGTAHRVAALSNKTFHPFSDFLVHDMGAANNDQRQMGTAGGEFWRTTPLWGLRHKVEMWHDGSITELDDAIAAHGGEGERSRDLYFVLPQFVQDWVDMFMESL
jgi:CxxC motif-containing protein (DUF1111 family)